MITRKYSIYSNTYKSYVPEWAFKSLASGSGQIVAWDFPERVFKKSFEIIKSICLEYDLTFEQPFAEWPHVTLAYIPAPSEDEKHKIKLAAPLYTTSVRLKNLVTLEGHLYPYTYVAWELHFQESKVRNLIDFINKLMGVEQKYEFRPHATIGAVKKADTEKLEKILPELEKAVSRFKTTYTPTQLQFWSNMSIYDIDSMKFS